LLEIIKIIVILFHNLYFAKDLKYLEREKHENQRRRY